MVLIPRMAVITTHREIREVMESKALTKVTAVMGLGQ
jgi:hypothetical protein